MTLPSPVDISAALHACLNQDMHVRAILGTPPRLYDDVPDDPVYPYLSYGAIRTQDVSADEAPLLNATINLHLHSRYEGKAEVMNALTTVLTALSRDRLRIHLPGCVSVVSRYADSFAARDGHSRHSVLRLALTVEGGVAEAA